MRRNNATDNVTPKLLVVEPSDSIRVLIAGHLDPDRFQVIESPDGRSAWTRYLRNRPSAILAALELPGLSGLELCSRVRKRDATPFIIYTTVHDVQATVSAMRAGADDVLVLPEQAEQLLDRLEHQLNRASKESCSHHQIQGIIGRSPAMRRLSARLAGTVGLRIPILLQGPRGSGRDFIASALADADGKTLVKIPYSRPRAPLRRDSGRLVYLDEIDRFPPNLQALWHQQLEAISQSRPGTPFRVLFSSIQDIGSMALQGEFDPRLGERLNRFRFELPPLRERPGDVGPLARALLARIGPRIGRDRIIISNHAISLLSRRAWPGNVAELEAVLEQLVAFSRNGRIGRRDVQDMPLGGASSVGSLRRLAEREQREQLAQLLHDTRGNLAEAARRLGISRGAVIYRAQKFGLMPPRATRTRSR